MAGESFRGQRGANFYLVDDRKRHMTSAQLSGYEQTRNKGRIFLCSVPAVSFQVQPEPGFRTQCPD